MPAILPRLSVCLFGMACLAGCGGSSKSSSSGGGGGDGGNNSPTIVTYTFTGSAPVAVATEIGTGAYTQATLQSGKLSISVPSGTANYSVAWLCPAISAGIFAENMENVVYRSTLDGTSFTQFCASILPPPQQGLATLQVNAVAIPKAFFVSVGGIDQQLSSGSTLSFSSQLATGTYDVFVVVYDLSFRPLAVRILRSQTIPGALNGGNPVVFAASDETTTQPVAYSNLPAGFTENFPFDTFTTSGGGTFTLTPYQSPLPQNEYVAMPSGAVQGGDFYLLEFVATLYSASSGTTEGVGVAEFTSTAGPQTITYPAPWTYTGPTAAILPSFKFDYSGFSGMPSVMQYALMEWTVGTTSNNLVELSATQNYQGGADSLAVPDLSGLTGFVAPASSGTRVEWDADIEAGSALSTTPPNGSIQLVTSSGSYTAP